MNRIIKFKAWEDQFHENHPNPTPNMVKWRYLETCTPNQWSGLKTMQYTGLKDKNGVEIYEGDIVLLGEKHRTKKENNIGYIIWSKYQYTMEGEGFSLLLCETNDIEVIGNIYENPELLAN